MEKLVYSIYDRATQTYSDPFYAFSSDDCFRAIRGAFAPASQLVLYPSDYVICNLGTWDSSTGKLVSDAVIEIEEIKHLIPVGLREYALDGTFDGGVSDEAQENSST